MDLDYYHFLCFNICLSKSKKKNLLFRVQIWSFEHIRPGKIDDTWHGICVSNVETKLQEKRQNRSWLVWSEFQFYKDSKNIYIMV